MFAAFLFLFILRGYRYAALASISDSNGKKQEAANWQKVSSWAEAVDLWDSFHRANLVSPHNCSSTFTSKESGFTGKSLGTTTPVALPPQSAPPPATSSTSATATPSTPTSSRRHTKKGKIFPMTPSLAASFTPTPAEPSMAGSHARARSTSPVRASSSSARTASVQSDYTGPFSQISQVSKHTWFVVWTSESEVTQIFDTM